MVASPLFFASLVALALGNPLTRRAMTVHETQVLPEGFSSRGAASPGAPGRVPRTGAGCYAE